MANEESSLCYVDDWTVPDTNTLNATAKAEVSITFVLRSDMASQDHIGNTRRLTASSLKVPNLHPSLKSPPVSNFRSKAARDLACILDLNAAVISWNSAPPPLHLAAPKYASDFEMVDSTGVRWMLDAPDRKPVLCSEVLCEAASMLGYRYRQVDSSEIYDGYRLKNARDLLRYSGHNVPLGDRVRLLGALDEEGLLSFADCMRVIRETQPVAALASLILQGLLEIELDDALIGPETMVRRIKG
ncbi:hypothetical protein [Rhizobium sp. 11515TR]|uniref:hypothetical protein n=1 Tax=Rhizobium sp. 11515TR TaxID=2028343 RepID=UPI001FCEB101|nr:hypothetical protein [Rhizobium sp. 11515TR]